MTLAGKTVLVTGANRGIGRALVEEALSRGAERVYAGTRQSLNPTDERVKPLLLDLTNAARINLAAETVDSLDVLINNAGVYGYEDLADRAALEQHLAVNLFGPHAVTQAFLPRLIESQGAIVNVLSLAAVAAVPISPAYSMSKAAAFSWTQSLRATLAGQGVDVHAVLPGPVDTDMVRDLEIPKTSPQSVAAAILDGLAKGEDEIFPDPFSQALADNWTSGAIKSLERQNAALVGEARSAHQ
ncbi:MAG: SDR family NAD(P)-dependent oxidoreductase [Saccharothrix sp.]|nr:SDR family NAD(P)-dependent oxidoreductase [Saccharothrix sp.]